MAETAGDCGIHDRYDALANVICGSRSLAGLVHKYGLNTGVAAYNFGSGNVEAVGGELQKMPKETQTYVRDVVARYNSLQHVGALIVEAPSPSPSPSPASTPFMPMLRLSSSPSQSTAETDPCAGRAWSLSHLLRFCGRLRIVPADPVERDLFYGNMLAAAIDAAQSAAGQRALFATRGLTAQDKLLRETWRADSYTLAQIRGISSPSAFETDSFMKPFAGGGIWTYLLGMSLITFGQTAIARDLPPALGLRPLDQASRNSIWLQDIYAHVQGSNSWTPVLNSSRIADRIVARCQAIAQADIDRNHILPLPDDKQCWPLWTWRSVTPWPHR
jgi:hypothetical protein